MTAGPAELVLSPVWRRGRLLAAVALLLTLCALVYLPGLSGGFLFDDYANLPALGRFGPVDNPESLALYLLSGIADPTGRPVAMLSFLVDANDWPAPAWGFKRTNLAIHLGNVLLLLILLMRLGERFGMTPRTAVTAALLSGGAWALHPLWVSTVLYVVQRHALLATTFVLAGLILWFEAERAWRRGKTRRAWLLAACSICACGLLAGLSKPNGFLLPVLALALASCLPAGSPAARSGRFWLLVIPTSLVLVALAGIAIFGDFSAREWTLGERLLTQPRVLADYLRLILLPGAYSSGVFSDGFQVSRDLLHPGSTLPALVLLATLGALAWNWRARRPLWSATIAFYLAGHLVESTVIPLELHFEHRNYLPAALLAWPLGAWLAQGRWRTLAGTVVLAGLAIACLARAALWGDNLALALNWARDYPGSARAQTHAAGELLALGRGDLVLQRMEPLFEEHPGEVQYALIVMNAKCLTGDADEALLDRVASALAPKGLTPDLVYQWTIDVAKRSAGAPCAALTDAAVQRLMHAVEPTAQSDVEVQARFDRLAGYVALRQGRCEEALSAFDRRMLRQPRPEGAIEQTGLLATQCSADAGLRHLLHFRDASRAGYARLPCCALRLRDRLMLHSGYWERELGRLESVLRQDVARARKDGDA